MNLTGVKTEGAMPVSRAEADVALGEDWIGHDAAAESAARARSRRRGVIAMNRSPLARKIITFNLLALLVLAAGIFILNPFRDSLKQQREASIVSEAQLLASVIEARMPDRAPVSLGAGDGADLTGLLERLALPGSAEVVLFDAAGRRLASATGADDRTDPADTQSTVIVDLLNRIWDSGAALFGRDAAGPGASTTNTADLAELVPAAIADGTRVRTTTDLGGFTVFSAAAPIRQGDRAIGVVAISSASGEIDRLVRAEREQVLQMFVIAILVSIGLSLVLASTIANPLSDLAAAAEIGQERNASRLAPNRVRIPDLTARPDEIGRLSGALRGMVAALYDRIDANEQFAADVAHEIKNPLASLRSAVASLRGSQREDHRQKLMDVIEHDTRRLDRLVSDISNASRLDSELVKEEEETFDLIRTIAALAEHLGEQASHKGVEFITDMPKDPIVIDGLESRLAQVFVNLITNAISFCEDGDAIRVWVRKRENRVLVVVEDTGPGIPEEALTKIFARFYSERPQNDFGNNSGLGLAISKQIVEAHGGVIWAENIRPTDADITSEPLGARFVVGLPV